MSCIKNINKFIVPNDVLFTLMNIYKYIGKNEHYENVASSDMHRIVSQTIERDTYFLSKLINLDITDARLRLIITKNSEARNREERVLYNLKELLSLFAQNPKRQELSSVDLSNIINYVYPNQNIKYDVLKEERKNIHHLITVGNKRDLIDEINHIILDLEDDAVESIVLLINYFVDMYAIKPFVSHNDTLVYLLLYLLLLKADVKAILYVSLFEMIYENKKDFDDLLKEACYTWNEGLPQILPFVRFFTKILLKLYEKTDSIIKSYETEQTINKGDNIENTIMNLPNIFTKDEIRLIHPYVSESTINRALTKLRDENIIKPLGKGRSAKWIKIGLK